MSRIAAIGASVVSGLLTLQLSVVGVMQIAGAEPIRSNIAEMGFPPWFRVGIGVAQIAGVAALWSRRTRFAAAVVLAVILTGAVVSHVRFGHDAEHTAPAVVTLALLVLLAIARRPEASAAHPARGR